MEVVIPADLEAAVAIATVEEIGRATASRVMAMLQDSDRRRASTCPPYVAFFPSTVSFWQDWEFRVNGT